LLEEAVVGTTPLSLDLPPGEHSLKLIPLAGGDTRVITVAIAAGTDSLVDVQLKTPDVVAPNAAMPEAAAP
jgi:hypothetical protein